MVRKIKRKKKTSSEVSDSTVKGRLVELIVASLHDVSGVKVERNVRLPAKESSRRKPEIDVLITSYIAGYPVRIAIECKNYKSPVGAPKINEFIGKLNDVGIPLQHGIFVSINGFTRGAIERAQKEGIRTLILTGLTEDRLSVELQRAFQSVVYLLPVAGAGVEAQVAHTELPGQMMVFYDDAGSVCGTVLDLIWGKWQEGYPPSSIGEYRYKLEIPSRWHQIVDGETDVVKNITAIVQVQGLVVTIPGESSHHLLVDAAGQKVERFGITVSFDTSKSKYPVRTFHTEDELNEFIDRRPEAVKLTIGRIRLPRVRFGPIFWPPSERVASVLSRLTEAYKAGEIAELRSEDLAGIEGDDLRTVWEPIWSGYPAAEAQE